MRYEIYEELFAVTTYHSQGKAIWESTVVAENEIPLWLVTTVMMEQGLCDFMLMIQFPSKIPLRVSGL